MTISLTCACGVRLEIDPKFAGQIIHCPDCNRPLSTAPVKPPARTSGLALASFILALVGAFTLVGTVAAAICGVLALRRLPFSREPLGGRRFVVAGLVLSGVFTVFTLANLATTKILGIDGLLRSLEWAGRIDYGGDLVVNNKGRGDFGIQLSIRRPSSSWGRMVNTNADNQKADDLVLLNPWEDAQIVCLSMKVNKQDGQDLSQEGLQCFLDSDLARNILGVSPNLSPPPVGKPGDGNDAQELTVDFRARGIDRTFLLQVQGEGARIMVVAGGTRKSRFARLQPQIRAALESFNLER